VSQISREIVIEIRGNFFFAKRSAGKRFGEAMRENSSLNSTFKQENSLFHI